MGEPKGTLRIGLLSPLQDLDPRTAADIMTDRVCRQVFESPCVLRNRQGNVRAALFETPLLPTRRGDIEATVRQDVIFADGTPLEAEDIVSCLRHAPPFHSITIELDGRRIFFRDAGPGKELEVALCSLRAAVWKPSRDGPVGTGPFRIARTTTGGAVDLVANRFYREPVAVEQIHFEVLPPNEEGEPRALVEALRTGEVDLTFDLPGTKAETLTGFTTKTTPGLSTALLFFNTARPPFDRLRWRRAAAKMLDRHELARMSYDKPQAHTATSLLPPELGRHWDRHALDVAAAIELAKPLERPDRPLDLLLTWGPRPYLPNPEGAARWIAEKLELLGLQVRAKTSVSARDFHLQAATGDYDIALAGWMLDSLEPSAYLESILSSERIPVPDNAGGDRFNVGRFASPEIDAALARYRALGSRGALADVLHLAAHRMPALPLLQGARSIVHSPRLEGITVSPGGVPLLSRARLSLPMTMA